MNYFHPAIFISFIFPCNFQNNNNNQEQDIRLKPEISSVNEIPLPAGFQRIKTDEHSFTNWLRSIKLKTDKHVYLYDGTLKKNQTVQYAVLDIPVGNKNLQQCADAVIRLRAEYLFAEKRFDEISFSDNNGKEYKWAKLNNRKEFDRYLETVFGMCGSASLEKQLKSLHNISEIEPGNVFIKGGFPGHAMIVIDIAVNNAGKKIFILAQGYMPAQDIHVVKNPMNQSLSPWYEVDSLDMIITPQWTFYKNQLKKW